VNLFPKWEFPIPYIAQDHRERSLENAFLLSKTDSFRPKDDGLGENHFPMQGDAGRG